LEQAVKVEPALMLSEISAVILDEGSSSARLQQALGEFAELCTAISGVAPDPSFDGWAEDSLLDDGVAINPRAAAHCVKDYRRSVMFLRGVDAALKVARERFAAAPVQVLYAGCGPYATLLLPLLNRVQPPELEITLLDIHQQSLDSVQKLISWFGLDDHNIQLVKADASRYRHAGTLHLIVAETMQKALEQEPQYAVTANLAPQLCSRGLFIPQKIEVELCLADLAAEREIFFHSGRIDADALAGAGKRCSLGVLLALEPGHTELKPAAVVIPAVEQLQCLDPLMFTRVQVFAGFHLRDYEAEITLPRHCPELLPLQSGSRYSVSYVPGKYPGFEFSGLTHGHAAID
jgi:hypothetical protein